jgi:CXXC-20-CXXC protein
MSARTCPHCQHHFPATDYIKQVWFRSNFDTFTCPSCKSDLRVKLPQRMILTVALLASAFFNYKLIAGEASFHLMAVLVVLVYLLVGVYVIMIQDRLKLA